MTSQERTNGVMFSMCLALVLVVASVSALIAVAFAVITFVRAPELNEDQVAVEADA